MSPKFEAPRGTHDVLPAEQPLWQRVTGEIERLCALYGYRRIQTPVFEDTELFARTSGAGSDVVQKEMYTFEDRGGRSLTLRAGCDGPDLPRVPRARLASRAAAAEALCSRVDLPLRRAPEGPLPRALPGLGRGDRLRRPALDAELIQLYVELLRRLGVTEYRLRAQLDRRCGTAVPPTSSA